MLRDSAQSRATYRMPSLLLGVVGSRCGGAGARDVLENRLKHVQVDGRSGDVISKTG